MIRNAVFACAVCLAAFVSVVSAQQDPAPVPLDRDDGDDILLIVKIDAKEIRMDVKPATRVDFPGTHSRSTFWLTERRNLPESLEPGVTYRDAGLTLRISSRFKEIERLLRDITNAMAAEAKEVTDQTSTQPAARREPNR